MEGGGCLILRRFQMAPNWISKSLRDSSEHSLTVIVSGTGSPAQEMTLETR